MLLAHIPEGSLTICYDISIMNQGTTEATYDALPIPGKRSRPLAADFSQMLNDKTFSDFEIECKEKVFSCHKTVLAARSEVFKAMLCMDGEEAKNNRLVIKDFEQEQVSAMLVFIYTGKIEDDVTVEPELLLLADKYDLPDLVSHCEQSLAKELNEETCLNLLEVAYKVSSDHLVKLCSGFAAQNLAKLKASPDWTRISKTNPAALLTILEEIS